LQLLPRIIQDATQWALYRLSDRPNYFCVFFKQLQIKQNKTTPSLFVLPAKNNMKSQHFFPKRKLIHLAASLDLEIQ
jgi:hypothetical protein